MCLHTDKENVYFVLKQISIKWGEIKPTWLKQKENAYIAFVTII